MRRVLKDPGEVIHFWANKVQSEGRTRTGHCFFRTPELLYSYGHHYCIGRHLPNGTVAINSTPNSVTTNGQVHQAWHAVSHLNRIRVPYPDRMAEDQIKTVQNQVTHWLDKAKRARLYADDYRAKARQIAEDFNLFAKALKERVRIDVSKFDAWDKVMANRDAAERKRHAAFRKQQEERARIAREQEMERQREGREKWRAGASGYFNYPVMLRLGYDGDRPEIQTSAGARISCRAAVRLWPLIQSVIAAGQDQSFDIKVGDYRLNSIKADGSITVGCHQIAFDEIKAMHERMTELNLFMEEEETTA